MQIYINISNALGIVCLHMIFQKQAERFFILFKSSILGQCPTTIWYAYFGRSS